MKKIPAVVFVFILLSFLSSQSAEAQTIIVDPRHSADSLSQDQLNAARQMVTYFNHRSIGNNILDGVADLASQNPSRYQINVVYSSGTNPGINHYQAGSNGNPSSKISGFAGNVKDGHKAAFMKFCVGDFPPWTSVPATDIWTQYRNMMIAQQAEHPGTTLVWWTSPITTQADGRGLSSFAAFNNAVRQYVNQNGGILFDIADIESHDPSGNAITRDGYEAMYNGYSTDGAHLNEIGRQRVASALWVLLAQAAGGSLPTATPTGIPTATPTQVIPTNTPTPTNTPVPGCIPGDANNNGLINIDDLKFVLLNYSEGPFSCADQNGDGIINSLDFGEVLDHLSLPTVTPTSSTSPTNTPTPTPTPSSGADGSLIWGGFYTPHSEAVNYGMSGVISGQLSSPQEIINYLDQADGNYGAVVTIGSVSECSHPIDGSEGDLSSALSYFQGILNFTPTQAARLNQHIRSGTLRAFRFYDEIHNAACGGEAVRLARCRVEPGYNVCLQTENLANNTCQTAGFRQPPPSINAFPVGENGAPGFGDFLFRIKNYLVAKGIDSNVVVGSTSASSYMLLAADRMKELGGSLSADSILAYGGPGNDQGIKYGGYPGVVREYMDCQTNWQPGSGVLYYLSNRSSQYGSDNYQFFADFIAMCEVANTDFMASWDWERGAPNFSVRMADLADGGVSSGGNTITLQDIQSACTK